MEKKKNKLFELGKAFAYKVLVKVVGLSYEESIILSSMAFPISYVVISAFSLSLNVHGNV